MNQIFLLDRPRSRPSSSIRRLPRTRTKDEDEEEKQKKINKPERNNPPMNAQQTNHPPLSPEADRVEDERQERERTAAGNQAIFDHERLDVYQLELSFVAWVTGLLDDVRNSGTGFYREVCDQLDRASLSSLLNTAEGNGKRQGKQRAKFFDDARGSSVECAACLDALVAKRLATMPQIAEGKSLLLRVVGMLTKLVDRFDKYRAHEGEESIDSMTSDEERGEHEQPQF